MKLAPVVLSDRWFARYALQVAAVSLLLIIGFYAAIVLCYFGAARASSKSEGVLFGSIIFVLILGAMPVGLLALPAIVWPPERIWPRFTFVLGFTPLMLLLLMFAVTLITSVLKTFWS
jgi:hypothetical protein